MAVNGSVSDVGFAGILDDELLSFVQEQENVNTKKTDSNVSLFHDFLREVRNVGVGLHISSFNMILTGAAFVTVC